MFSLPGLPADAIVSILVYGFGFIFFVGALARLLRELLLDARIRLKTESPLLTFFTPAVILMCGLSMYFYVLSISALLMASYPDDIPDMTAAWAEPLLALSATVWRTNESAPLPMAWFGAAFLLHIGAEVLRYLLGVPLRRRDRLRFIGALDSFAAIKRTGAAKEARSPLKRGQ
jgi:hypothetical protein